jgi:predicted alpha/beta superfamily hydrolase
MFAMLLQWNVTIPTLTGDVPRRAYVYVPDAAREDPEVRYPVLYMFDGHNLFSDEDATYGKSWGLQDYLVYTDTPLIVAAVECNHDPNGGRLSEYSPFDFQMQGVGAIQGHGKQTMDWFTQVFKPEVDAQFPTLPDRAHTFIGGSSMGGLMSLYAVLQYNRVFSRAAALSPSVWVDPQGMAQLIDRAKVRRDTVIYLDYGSRELRNHKDMLQQFTGVTARLLEKQLLVTSRIVPGGGHNEASWEQQIPFFLGTLLYDLEP